jgi:hypothetical protein
VTLLSRSRAIALGAVGLLGSVLLLGGLVDRAVGSAVCIERAKYELILCAAPPDVLTWAVSAALAIAFAVGLGMAVGAPGSRSADPATRRTARPEPSLK